jgi:hypothetical protein
MNPLTKQPSERALNLAEEVLDYILRNSSTPVPTRIIGCQYGVATIIDRHCDGLADELAEALRGVMREFVPASHYWSEMEEKAARFAADTLNRYDETKGGRNDK